MMKKIRALVINEKDNVATALEPLDTGNTVTVSVQGTLQKIRLLSDVPMGHKLAIKDIAKGKALIKYGEAIGQSTADIFRGEHVHIHNVKSQSGDF